MRLEELTDEAIDHIYDNLLVERLPDSLQDFIMNTKEQWERDRFLTDNQKLALGRVWDRQP